jgi:hypothetical protein
MQSTTLNKAKKQRLEAAFDVLDNPIFSTLNQPLTKICKWLFYIRSHEIFHTTLIKL